MVSWKSFDVDTDLNKILERVGMDPSSEAMSNPFLVMVRFRSSSKDYEPRFAQISLSSRTREKPSVLIWGLSGRVQISHWSPISYPKGATQTSFESLV